MRITRFTVQHIEAFNPKIITFGHQVNIIFSKINSTGKTTLMRAILYTLGFPVPSTKPISFEDYEFNLELSHTNSLFHVNRKGQVLTVNGQEFDLPINQRESQMFLFNIGNVEVLYNLLGTFYFDQENGWTLLNRGQVIGGVRFNVESFFRGLKDDESSESYEIVAKINALSKKIAQYKLILNVAEYQATLQKDVEQKLDFQTYHQSLDTTLLERQARLQKLEGEISKLTDVMNNSKRFGDYIETKNVFVNIGDDKPPMRVTKDNLHYYNEVEEINSTRKSILLAERNSLKNEIAEIEASQDKQITLDNLPRPEDEMISRLASIQKISSVEVKKMLYMYQKEKQNLSKALVGKTNENNPWISDAYKIIRNYANELGMPADYKIKIFTRDKKAKSGAILHKLVFIYKLAFIKLLSKKLGYPVPIFCDSPSGREVIRETISAMMSILKRDFSEHQIIISSIHKFDDVYSDANIIEVDGTIFDEQNLSDFYPEHL